MNIISFFKGRRIAREIKNSNYYARFFEASLTMLSNHNVVYIESSKVGCTKIKTLLLEIDNWPKRWDQLIEKEVDIHEKKITGLLGAADLTYSELYTVLHDPSYFRFGFVRNPYDRLISAYKDKILAPQKSPDKRHYVSKACEIKAEFTGQLPHEINLDETPVSFSEFVHYVNREQPYDMDRHWFYQYLTMWHPFCKLDFIGRFENFQEDLKNILTIIKAPERVLNSIKEPANMSVRMSDKFYNAELADIVYHKFRKDFEIYNYDPNSWENY